MRIYLDGVEVGVAQNSQGINWNYIQTGFPDPGQIYLSAFKSNVFGSGLTVPDQDFFNGEIDEVQIYTRTLSPAEVSLLASG